VVTQNVATVAGPEAAPRTVIVPADAVRALLRAQNVTAAEGRAGVELAKESVVRVICVRK
jgi:hypothetical protein